MGAATDIALPERYRLLGHIASGGMAAVYAAQDRLLDRRVAVKVLAAHLASEPGAQERFAREARAAARVSNHPHVVTIYDVGQHEGRAFMVMEHMAAGTLADRLRDDVARAEQELSRHDGDISRKEQDLLSAEKEVAREEEDVMKKQADVDQARQRLEPGPGLGVGLLHLLYARGQVLFPVVQVLAALLLVRFALVEDVEFAVQRLGALHQTSLQPLRLLALAVLLGLPRLPEAHHLLLALELALASEALGFLPGTLEDEGGFVLGGRAFALLPGALPGSGDGEAGRGPDGEGKAGRRQRED
ncbi:MAG: protein kinase [Gemmatimonadetes bacterium]|nr:protein kinase [Gemmatimonadota bacterium]